MRIRRGNVRNTAICAGGVLALLAFMYTLFDVGKLHHDIRGVFRDIGREDDQRETSGRELTAEEKEAVIRQRFSDRKLLLQEACNKHQLRMTQYFRASDRKTVGFSLKHIEERNLAYCAIEKSGSTFWKRILHVVGGWSNDSNPASIRSKDADSDNGGFDTLVNASLTEMFNVVNESSSIMIVRDPYARLFSAWLDKFYSPNHYYWATVGPLIGKSERPYVSQIPTCAHDITFSEFINYILKQLQWNRRLDGHFSPNSDHCYPCRMPYDYIGKYETLKEDTLHIIGALNLTSLVTFGNFEGNAIWDAVKDSCDFVFTNREKLESCGVPFRCILFKVWSRMQSRGILSANIPFPYETDAEAENVTEIEFGTAILQANHASNPKELKNNRKEALTQAYQSISLRSVAQLIRTFEIDFDMFGYERYPEFLKLMKTTPPREYFRECPKDKPKPINVLF